MDKNETHEPDFMVIDFPEFDQDTILGDTTSDDEVTDVDEIQDTIEEPETQETVVEEVAERETSQEKEPTPETTQGSEIDPRIEAHYKYMFDQGYLTPGEDFEFDGTNIDEAYERDAQVRTNQIAQQLINSFPDRGKELVNYILQGGTDLDGFFQIKTKEELYESLDVNNKEDAKNIVTQYMKDLGLQDRAIEYTIESYELSETLTEEANRIKTARIAEMEQEKQNKIAQERQLAEQMQAETQRYFDEASEYLNNTSWSNSKKNEVLNSLFVNQPNGMTRTQEIMQHIFKSPKSAAVLTDILLGYDAKKDEWSFKRIEDSLKSKVTRKVKNSFDEYLSGSDSAIVRSDGTPTDKKSFDWSNVEIVEN